MRIVHLSDLVFFQTRNASPNWEGSYSKKLCIIDARRRFWAGPVSIALGGPGIHRTRADKRHVRFRSGILGRKSNGAERLADIRPREGTSFRRRVASPTTADVESRASFA